MRRCRSFSSGEGSIPSPSTSNPGAAERTQGLRLPSRPVQRQHVEGAQVLAERMLDGQRIELGDDLTVPSRPHVGVDPALEGGQAQLGQAGDLTVEEPVGLDVGVGMASPHRQRLAQLGRRLARDRPSLTPSGRRPRTPSRRLSSSCSPRSNRRPGGRSRRRGHGGGWRRRCGAWLGCSGGVLAVGREQRCSTDTGRPAAATRTATTPRCFGPPSARSARRPGPRAGPAPGSPASGPRCGPR